MTRKALSVRQPCGVEGRDSALCRCRIAAWDASVLHQLERRMQPQLPVIPDMQAKSECEVPFGLPDGSLMRPQMRRKRPAYHRLVVL